MTQILVLINILLSLLALHLKSLAIGLYSKIATLYHAGKINKEIVREVSASSFSNDLSTTAFVLGILSLIMALIMYKKKICNRYFAFFVVMFTILILFIMHVLPSLI
jgi:uncharacterized membrane protein YjdF